MPTVESSVLSYIRYDAKRRELFVVFRATWKKYVYEDVSAAEYAALMAAESKGVWFNAHIRDTHRFRAA
jgi:hypothetical protein